MEAGDWPDRHTDRPQVVSRAREVVGTGSTYSGSAGIGKEATWKGVNIQAGTKLASGVQRGTVVGYQAALSTTVMVSGSG